MDRFVLFFFLSSPFLFLFNVDRVTRHAGGNVNPDEDIDA